MMNENLYSMNNTKAWREAVKILLASEVKKYKKDSNAGRTIAYKIAGLLSSNVAHSLPNDDPHIQVLTLAGELELPENQRNSATWDELIHKVKNLK